MSIQSANAVHSVSSAPDHVCQVTTPERNKALLAGHAREAVPNTCANTCSLSIKCSFLHLH